MSPSVLIVGIDLAWGERRPDGVCVLEVGPQSSRVRHLGLSRGDGPLLALVASCAAASPTLLAFDAPLASPNLTGSRPADRLSHVLFHREKCGCHPTNATRCPRPLRLSAALKAAGHVVDWAMPENPRALRHAVEVYPHPALVRWFGLTERIPYKKGPVAARRLEFARLQALLRQWLPRHFPRFVLDANTATLLAEAWTKDIEDQTDSLVCALIGEWHWRHRGTLTQVVGDRETGFFIVPQVIQGTQTASPP